MNIGNIIKYHRVSNDLTQSELCRGICSITHLSKIENNNKEAEQETISLLLARLGLTLSQIENHNKELENKLNTFLNDIIFYNKEAASVTYSTLVKDEQQFMKSDFVYIFHLYSYRYHLFLGDTDTSIKKKRILEQFTLSFSQHETHLFQYFNAILLIQQGQFSQALLNLKLFEEDIPLPYPLEGEFYYQIALAYSNLKDSSSCITYAQKAIKEFSYQYNYIRILHAQILLAIHYTELELFQEAIEHFTHLLRNVNLLNGTELKATVHHNFAMLCEKQLDLEKALEHYLIAQNSALNSQQFYMSFCNTTEILINRGVHDEALKNIAIILEHTKTKLMKKHNLIFQYYEYILLGKPKTAFTFLEKQVLPYLEKNNLSKEIRKYSLLLAEFYSNIDKDKAIYYYRKVGV